ncbi:unnamed protein product [Diamesa serratosioi]
MGGFWKSIFQCYGNNKSSESVDKRLRKDNPNKSDNNIVVESKVGCKNDIRKRRNETSKKFVITDATIANNSSKIINNSPKVILTKTLLNKQKDFEFPVFAGSLNKRSVAIRIMKKEFDLEAVQESELLMKLDNHESIIKFHFKFEDIEKIYIITEYYETSLEDYVNKTDEQKALSVKQLCLQITEAVDFIHKHKIIYLNLNPQNIYILGSHDTEKVKLTNFSSAGQLTDKNTDLKQSVPLMDGFSAPEQHSLTEKQNLSTDIFMLGCTFYYIITNGLKLFKMINRNQENKLLGALHRYQEKNKSSDVVLGFDITIKMLNFIKNKRASTELILKHPFFWSSEELLNYIIDVSVRIEERDWRFLNKLETKSKFVVGMDWTVQLVDIYEDISNKRNYNGKSVKDLVQAIRNRIVHTSSSRVIEVMGSSKEDLKNYWLEMFPHLIPHLYQAMNTKFR